MRQKAVKVLLVGSYPPPYGGESVEVSVLRRLLLDMPGLTSRVLDIGESRDQRRRECLSVRSPLDFLGKLLLHAACQYTIHLNTNGHNLKSWRISLACAAAGVFNGRKTVLTLGSGLAPDFIQNERFGRRILIKITLGLMGAIICRNERTRTTVVNLGIRPEKIMILSGFYGISSDQSREVPEQIEEFLRQHSPVLAAIASSGPEYGLHLIVEAATRLRSLYPRLGVLLIGPQGVEEHDLDGNLLVTGALPHDVVLGVLGKLDLFVRPTYFDGDASSVREALSMGVPVVASDTDFRPEGVILFRRGDGGDLFTKITQVLGTGRNLKAHQDHGSSSLQGLLEIYRRLNGTTV